MKKTVLLLAMAVSALCCGDTEDLWRSTPFYHGAAVYTDRKEDRVNLWPLLYHRAPATSVLWPVFSSSDDHLAVSPLYSQRRQRGAGGAYDEFNVLWPICHFDLLHNRHHVFPVYWGEDRFVVLPLFMADAETLFLPPFWYRRDGSAFVALPFCGWQDRVGDRLWWAAAGLAGGTRARDGSGSGWLLPLFYCGDSGFYSLPYARFGHAGDTVDLVGCGLLGRRTLPGGHAGCWVFPLFYADNRSLVTPLGGRSEDEDWLLLLYSRKGDEFMSLPYGRYRKEGSVHRWFASPLVGSVSGRKEGAYVFPFLDYEEDDVFASFQADFEAGRMPSSVVSRTVAATNVQGRAVRSTRLDCGHKTGRKSNLLLGLLYNRKTRISDRPVENGKGYELTRSEEAWSLPFLYNRDVKEKVEFDASTRRLLRRSVVESSSLMSPLYTNRRSVDAATNAATARTRVLWWLWDREEKDGKVSLDVFPGFTYDRHPDGYSKTSFAWRLFRYEDDPKGGASVDLFFLPVWR